MAMGSSGEDAPGYAPAAEELAVAELLSAEVRDRWRTLLATPKGRVKAIAELSEFVKWLDPHRRLTVARDATEGSISVWLRDQGAPKDCRVMSERPALDGREMPLIDALKATAAGGVGSLLLCVPGKLIYYQHPTVDVRFAVRKK